MERHPGLMGRPDPTDGTDLLEENREWSCPSYAELLDGYGAPIDPLCWIGERTGFAAGNAPRRPRADHSVRDIVHFAVAARFAYQIGDPETARGQQCASAHHPVPRLLARR